MNIRILFTALLFLTPAWAGATGDSDCTEAECEPQLAALQDVTDEAASQIPELKDLPAIEKYLEGLVGKTVVIHDFHPS